MGTVMTSIGPWSPRPSKFVRAVSPVPVAVGFGLGVILTSLLSHEETWSERNLPDSVRNMPDSIHQLAEAIARRLPSSLTRG